jgi:3-oxoacyl-[acyl-carrier protein] reductase
VRLRGKDSIITGGAQGIGLATAQNFAAEGAIVVVADLKQESVDAAVSKLRRGGATAEGFAIDVTPRAQVDDMVRSLKTRFGRIDLLVNIASDEASCINGAAIEVAGGPTVR